MPNLGPMEILVVLMVALIVLGPKRLPEAGRQVGRAVAEVRRWSNSMQAEVRAVLDEDVEAPPPAPWNSEPTPTVETPSSGSESAEVAGRATNGDAPEPPPTAATSDDRPPA